jgi:hypothetical protein
MSGGIATGTARVRIKGKRGSVVRFLILSVSDLMICKPISRAYPSTHVYVMYYRPTNPSPPCSCCMRTPTSEPVLPEPTMLWLKQRVLHVAITHTLPRVAMLIFWLGVLALNWSLLCCAVWCCLGAVQISYTLPWIIMLSQLAYYSKVYGPQVTILTHRPAMQQQHLGTCLGSNRSTCCCSKARPGSPLKLSAKDTSRPARTPNTC